ncbi:MAG: hypothetical protein RBS57_19485, partial [Desulforhabdus sp.]|nr:hypothetical protein [Desulforhabdus sp.]
DINAYLAEYSNREIMGAIFADSQFAQQYLRREEVGKLIDKTLKGSETYGWQIWSLYLCSLASRQLQRPDSASSLNVMQNGEHASK